MNAAEIERRRQAPGQDYSPPSGFMVARAGKLRRFSKMNRWEVGHLALQDQRDPRDRRRRAKRWRTICNRPIRKSGVGGIDVCAGFQWWAKVVLCEHCKRALSRMPAKRRGR